MLLVFNVAEPLASRTRVDPFRCCWVVSGSYEIIYTLTRVSETSGGVIPDMTVVFEAVIHVLIRFLARNDTKKMSENLFGKEIRTYLRPKQNAVSC